MSIIKSWNGRAIRIREDRYVSLTDMAQASGKLFGHWNENKSAKAYLSTLSTVIGIPTTELIQVNQGGVPEEQGTWGHPKVALRFAQWCSDDFAVQVDLWIDELLTTGKVELAPQVEQPQRQLPPVRDAVDYIQAAQTLENLKNPMLRSLLEQRLAEDVTPTNRLLTSTAQPQATHVIASVRAAQLGDTPKSKLKAVLGWVNSC